MMTGMDGDDMELSYAEFAGFMRHGTGSRASDRWLYAILAIIHAYDDEGLWTIVPPDGGLGDIRGIHGIDLMKARNTVSRAVCAFSLGVSGRGSAQCEGKRLETGGGTMRNALDTLIRFAMTRHDVTGPLCADDGHDMMDGIISVLNRVESDPKRQSRYIIPILARHMIIPVLLHAGDSADDVFDAISAGYSVQCSMWIDGSGSIEDYHIPPMTPCLDYDGPHCGPRLAAMWADFDVLEEEAWAPSMAAPIQMLVTAMPGAADMGIPAAMDTIIGMESDDINEVIHGADKGLAVGTFPPMDWDTYRLAMRSGARVLKRLWLQGCLDEAMDGYGCASPTADPDEHTWISRMRQGNAVIKKMGDLRGMRGMDMSDSAFVTGCAISPATPDPTLTIDVIRACADPGWYMGCGDPVLEDVACSAIMQGQGRRNTVECMRYAAIHMHDARLLSASWIMDGVADRMRDLIPDGDGMIPSPGTNFHRIMLDSGIVFLDMDDLRLFFESLENDIPETFAMETLVASSRRFKAMDPIPSDAHGVAVTLDWINAVSVITV